MRVEYYSRDREAQAQESSRLPDLYYLLQFIQIEFIFPQLCCPSTVTPPNAPHGLSQKSGSYP